MAASRGGSWLFALCACALCAAPAGAESIQVALNVSFSGAQLALLNGTGIDAAALQQHLVTLAASDPRFAGALVGAMVDLYSSNLVSPTVCTAGSPDPACACPAGTRKVYAADGIAFICPQCPPGGYSGADAAECTPCWAGTYQPAFAATSAAACRYCGGSAFSLGNASACTPCAAGYEANPDKTACVQCPPGTYSAGAASSCQPCPPGYYCSGGMVGPSDPAAQCPFDASQAATAATDASQSRCAPCLQDYYCPTATALRPCPAGTTSAGGSASELQCACQAGFECRYTRVVHAVVALYMAKAALANETAAAFVQAVAGAAGVGGGDVNVVSVADAPAAAPDAPAVCRVRLQVRNALGLAGLNQELGQRGLGGSASHNYFAGHQVAVRRVWV